MLLTEDTDDRRNNNVTDGDKTPAQCCNHEHFPIVVVDEVFNFNVDDLFNRLFTDSELFRIFVQQRQTYDVKLAPWLDTPDINGVKTRVIYYTLSINYAIGPKCSPSTETQTMHAESKPGYGYVIDADCVNGGVPYGENFYTSVRYCMTRVSDTTTRLNVTGKVIYKKRMWGLIKNFIDKTANTGIKVSFGVMAELLRRESDGRGPPHGYRPVESVPQDSPVPPVRRVRRPNSDDQGESRQREPARPPRVPHRRSHCMHTLTQGHSSSYRRDQDSPLPHNTDVSKFTELLATFIFVMVLILIAFHVIFYMQLASIESTVSKAFVKSSAH
jgi:hypothetical protein